MAIYQALFTSKTDSENLDVVEIDAVSKDVAYELAKNYNYSSELWEFTQLIRKPQQVGGARAGAGRPLKHGEKCKIMRVPESLTPKIDTLVTSLPELAELLSDLEADCKNSSSPRYYFLRQALSEIRSMGF